MMALIFRLLGGGWLTYALIAAAFAGGVAAGLRWERGNTMEAKAETSRIVGELASKAAAEATARAKAATLAADARAKEAEARAAALIAHEQEKARKATAIAASAARQARDAETRLRELRETHRDITSIFRAEPPSAGPCVFMFSRADIQRLLRIPAGAASAAGQARPAAAPGSSNDLLP
jgi:hypothetical protein